MGALDFVVFVVISVAACASGHLWLRHQRAGGMSLGVWVAVAAIVGATFLEADRVETSEKSRIERTLIGYAKLFAHHLERLGHEKLSFDTSPLDPRYLAIVGAERDWQNVVPVVHDVYTLRHLPDGRKAFLVDSETDYDGDGQYTGGVESRTEIGEPYDKVDPGMDMAFAGEGNFNPEPVADRWGTWVTASWPLLDKAGAVEGIVGVDYDAASFSSAGHGGRIRVIAYGTVLELLLLGSAIFVALARCRADEKEKARRESEIRENRFRMFMDHSPAVAFIKDEEGRYTYVSAAHKRILGRDDAGILGKTDHDIYPADVVATLRRHDSQVLEMGVPLETLEAVPDAKGNLRQWWVAKFPLPTAEGARQVGAVCMDISAQIKLEEHLRQTQKMESVGQLAAGIAHDFNNMLTALTAGAHSILEARPGGEIQKHAAFIAKEVERASELVRRLLAFARRQTLQRSPHDIAGVLTENAELLRRTLGEDVVIECAIDRNLPSVNLDAGALGQVLVNLGVNARDAMPEGGKLRIAAREVNIEDPRPHGPLAKPGRYVALEISDTGCGIDDASKLRLFEPFFTTKEVGKGTGLGLASAYGIIRQHEGWISVVSEPGKGATFRIFLPVSRNSSSAHSSVKPAADRENVQFLPKSLRTILVVEDNPSVKVTFRALLSGAGRVVLEASCVEEAEVLWEAHRTEIDAVITDMVMPGGVSGKEFADRVLRESEDIPVICTTGYAPESTGLEHFAGDRSAVLPKPFSPCDLRVLLTELMARRDQLTRTG